MIGKGSSDENDLEKEERALRELQRQQEERYDAFTVKVLKYTQELSYFCFLPLTTGYK